MIEQIKNVRIERKHEKPILADVFYKANEKPKPVLILCHGFKGFKDWGTFDLIAQSMAAKDYVFIKFNFSHNGTTPDNPDEIVDPEAFGENNFKKELDDIGSVIDWASGNNIVSDPEIDLFKIYLCGHSRGGTTSIIKAGEDSRIKKLVTWAAPRSLEGGWNDEEVLANWKKDGVVYIENKRTGEHLPLNYQIAEDYFANKDRYNVESAIKSMEIPCMVIHGTEDESVPFEHAIEMKRWNKEINMELVPHANHTFGGYHPFKKAELPEDTELLLNLTDKFLKGIPERRRRRR